VAVSFSYGDAAPWPIAADGGGYSLVLVNPASGSDRSHGTSWRASASVHGSPGLDDPAVAFPSGGRERGARNPTAGQTDAVELHNLSNETVDIGHWWLSDDSANPRRYRFPAGTSIAAGGYLIVTEAQFNPSPGVVPSFAFSAAGEAVYLSSGDSGGTSRAIAMDLCSAPRIEVLRSAGI
jgi:hypothetical protein